MQPAAAQTRPTRPEQLRHRWAELKPCNGLVRPGQNRWSRTTPKAEVALKQGASPAMDMAPWNLSRQVRPSCCLVIVTKPPRRRASTATRRERRQQWRSIPAAGPHVILGEQRSRCSAQMPS